MNSIIPTLTVAQEDTITDLSCAPFALVLPQMDRVIVLPEDNIVHLAVSSEIGEANSRLLCAIRTGGKLKHT